MDTNKDILEKIKAIVKTQNPSAKIYFYGSRAKGLANAHSDWDILILLNKDKISLSDERSITYPLYDLEFETGEIISPIVYSEKEWNTKHSITPFYEQVVKYGRLL